MLAQIFFSQRSILFVIYLCSKFGFALVETTNCLNSQEMLDIGINFVLVLNARFWSYTVFVFSLLFFRFDVFLYDLSKLCQEW